MRKIHFILLALIVGLAVVIVQGGHRQGLVPGVHMERAEAGSGQPMGGTTDSARHELTAKDLEAEADAYDAEADRIQIQVMKYKSEAAAITPLMDTKGFRRSALLMAAASQSKAVAELRQLAAHHRSEAKRLMAKTQAQ